MPWRSKKPAAITFSDACNEQPALQPADRACQPLGCQPSAARPGRREQAQQLECTRLASPGWCSLRAAAALPAAPAQAPAALWFEVPDDRQRQMASPWELLRQASARKRHKTGAAAKAEPEQARPPQPVPHTRRGAPLMAGSVRAAGPGQLPCLWVHCQQEAPGPAPHRLPGQAGRPGHAWAAPCSSCARHACLLQSGMSACAAPQLSRGICICCADAKQVRPPPEQQQREQPDAASQTGTQPDALARLMHQQRVLSTPDSFVLSHAQGTGWHWWWFSDGSAGRKARVQAVLQQHAQAAQQAPPAAEQPSRPPAVLLTPRDGFVKGSELLQPSPGTPAACTPAPAPQPPSQTVQPAPVQVRQEAAPPLVAWTATVAGESDGLTLCCPAVASTAAAVAARRQHQGRAVPGQGAQAADQRAQRSRRPSVLGHCRLAQ